MNDRVAVLIHGCHLQALLSGETGTERWEDIVWGLDSEGNPSLSGRATMGLKVAFDHEAEFVIFSTGASERDGKKEGEYTRDWALGAYERLAPVVGYEMSPTSLEAYLMDATELDIVSQNTREECNRNFRLCAERGISRVILVSSPWHIQRCHTEALKVAEELRLEGIDVPEIMAVASHGSTNGVVILEPPHRGDRPRTVWHELAPRFFKVPEERLHAFFSEALELFEAYEA